MSGDECSVIQWYWIPKKKKFSQGKNKANLIWPNIFTWILYPHTPLSSHRVSFHLLWSCVGSSHRLAASLIISMNLILPNLVSPHVFLSHLMPTQFIWSHLVPFHFIPSPLILPCLVSSHSILFHLVSSHPVSPYLISSCLILVNLRGCQILLFWKSAFRSAERQWSHPISYHISYSKKLK